MEYQGRRRQHEYRRHVVAQGGDGHGGMVESFKEEHPVQAQQQAAEQEFGGPLLQFVPVEGDMPCLHQHQESQASQGRPQERQRHGPQGNEPAHQADGPENGQGQEHPAPGREKRKIHGCISILCFELGKQGCCRSNSPVNGR